MRVGRGEPYESRFIGCPVWLSVTKTRDRAVFRVHDRDVYDPLRRVGLVYPLKRLRPAVVVTAGHPPPGFPFRINDRIKHIPIDGLDADHAAAGLIERVQLDP